MHRTANLIAVAALLAAAASAQGRKFLFTTSQTEQSLSGSGGTVLNTFRPNEIIEADFSICPIVSAEKYEPRTCFHTMAGDENGDAMYFNPTIFGNIDALLEMPSAIAAANQRTIFFSPAVDMGTGVSGLPGLRRGDTGRIVRTTAGDGRVEYFLRAEQVQQSLGMPPTPAVVDVDAIAAGPNYGVFFSLDQDTFVNTGCGVLFVRDGDVLLIPAWAITWTPDMRVAAVVPGSAHVVYTEAQMDAFVVNAQVTDRFGACLTAIQDLEALEIDWSGPVTTSVGCTGVALPVPTLIFTSELGTGASVLTTAAGGQIYNAPCGPLGTSCGFGPTPGSQMGLLPPGGPGVPSYVNALASTFVNRFLLEPQQHVFNNGNPAVIDIYSPAAFTWLFVGFAPTGINAVAPSLPFPWNPCFPDVYNLSFISGVVTPGGWGSYTSPIVPWPCKLLWQAATINSSSQICISSPATTDVL